MVLGIDSFREKFKDYTDYYTIIGGTACDILLTEADLPFRATKDIDMILIMEDNFPEFATIFWEYIKELLMVLVFWEQSILFRSKCMRGLTFWTERDSENM